MTRLVNDLIIKVRSPELIHLFIIAAKIVWLPEGHALKPVRNEQFVLDEAVIGIVILLIRFPQRLNIIILTLQLIIVHIRGPFRNDLLNRANSAPDRENEAAHDQQAEERKIARAPICVPLLMMLKVKWKREPEAWNPIHCIIFDPLQFCQTSLEESYFLNLLLNLFFLRRGARKDMLTHIDAELRQAIIILIESMFLHEI